MELQTTVFNIAIITVVVAFLIIFTSKKVDHADPMAKPSMFVTVIVSLATMILNTAKASLGEEKAKMLTPYILVLWMYIFLSNISGLFGIESPTSNFSVTILLSFITWVLIQITIFRYSGVKAYFKSFFEPIPVMLPMNIMGKFSTMLSMAMRLFGNITCGSIMMQLVYMGTQNLSKAIVGLFGASSNFNFMAPIMAPLLHIYFDLFAGFIQTLVFVTLTIILIGNEIPDTEKN
ncbi:MULTISPECIES: F0F1 ATP synthase subunit A [Terrabacteria group]|uniref:F0F1 ATP synthase subunit A n=1 Tax=Bacillati TaxID=1783272 RepID=UPI001C6DE72D|nr:MULTISPECIES: F0F1 ATP synthase subunit A [Terrabacteria group]MBW9212484.1 F0F1 ATP synthase subunit A [Trueperella sp. zg.1013]